MFLQNLLLESVRATEFIDQLFLRIGLIFHSIFTTGTNGYMRMLIATIVSNPYLLVCVSLILCGFVLGIIKRLISF